MLYPRYELKSDKSLTVFEFVSIGKKGEIPKIVQYSETNLKFFYNLAFLVRRRSQIDEKN